MQEQEVRQLIEEVRVGTLPVCFWSGRAVDPGLVGKAAAVRAHARAGPMPVPAARPRRRMVSRLIKAAARCLFCSPCSWRPTRPVR